LWSVGKEQAKANEEETEISNAYLSWCESIVEVIDGESFDAQSQPPRQTRLILANIKHND